MNGYCYKHGEYPAGEPCPGCWRQAAGDRSPFENYTEIMRDPYYVKPRGSWHAAVALTAAIATGVLVAAAVLWFPSAAAAAVVTAFVAGLATANWANGSP